MNIVGFNLTKASAERYEQLTGDVSISTNIEIKEIEKKDLDIIKDLDTLKVEFELKISYDSKTNEKKKPVKTQGLVEFSGNVLISMEPEAAKEILKAHKKKETPISFKETMLNVILRRCSIKALELEEQVELPPHFRLPVLSLQKKE
ncbi:MAG: hypothetical protein WCK90_03540 [archaeon]